MSSAWGGPRFAAWQGTDPSPVSVIKQPFHPQILSSSLPFLTPNPSLPCSAISTPVRSVFRLFRFLSLGFSLPSSIIACWIQEYLCPKMSSRTGKGPAVRSYRRRKAGLDLDLNRPAGENREHEGPSTQPGPQLVQAVQLPQVMQPATIDVEAIDDDVVECSRSAFAEARNNSRRNRGRTIVDVDLEDQVRATNNNNRNKRRRELANHTIINCDLYINLEGGNNSMRENVKKPPEAPKEPVFSCPICMGPLVEEMSTRCGHIFCKNCIKAAITAQGKCPTCRKKITVKELIRVFLPSSS
ncbi:hypothetical protein RJT34_31754 [Clitoria ternatea]|uniref:RING-type domain-containing protein n=1 Tax=Clitoria ternatea TaxID=43366 RepID=A0AAN9EZ25_CLITE